jgi:hypothetical protein
MNEKLLSIILDDDKFHQNLSPEEAMKWKIKKEI